MPLLYRLMALMLVLVPVFATPAGAQAPERRFALVIGNTEYKAGRLPTAANDAGLVAETLRTAGFDVSGARDLDQDTLRRSLREFLDKVSAAGPQAVSFIYLAGYGLQFEGENYFVPIDATLARDEDIPIEAIRISDFVRSLSGMPGAVKLVVMDAARQHPYTPAGTPLASGLGLVDPDPGMLIAFNTAPGSVAPVEDGSYGAFGQALAEMIATGSLGLDDVFSRLRLRVNETTQGVAVPWYASKITQAFLFTERTADAPPPPQQAVASMELQSRPIQQFNGEQEAYNAALERDTISGYEEFVAAYPDSQQVTRVRALIAVRREAIMWRRALSNGTREAYWTYLQRYPQGAHVADAERRLARLSAADDPPPAFVPMAFADVDPPPPDEVVYLNQPVITFNDPAFVPPPPPPDYFCPPPPPAFVALPPPPPPIGAFFLPAPVVTLFTGPRPWVRPPEFVVAPPRPPIQQITINNTTIINERVGGSVGLMSPTLPGAVVTRVNSGVLHVPPPAPPAPPPVLHNAAMHPGVGVLGTQVALPPRVRAAAVPGAIPAPHTPGTPPPPGAMHAPVPGTVATPPGALTAPAHQLPSTAATTPGGPHAPVLPGAPGQHQLPGTAAVPSGAPGASALPGAPSHQLPGTAAPPPGVAIAPAGHPAGGPPEAAIPGVQPHVAEPSPPSHMVPALSPGNAAPPATHHEGLPPAPHVAEPSPPAHMAPAPPPAAHTAPAAPPVMHHEAPPPAPHVAAPSPPAHVAPPPPAAHPAPAPPVMHHEAPPPAAHVAAPPPPPPPPHMAPPPPPAAHPAPQPPAGKKCVVENGHQVCR